MCILHSPLGRSYLNNNVNTNEQLRLESYHQEIIACASINEILYRITSIKPFQTFNLI